MKWKKLGRLFVTDNIHPQLITHAANPVILYLKGNKFRVFYSGRDIDNRASISFFDMQLDGENFSIDYVHKQPILTPGRIGCFDDSGVSVSCILQVDDTLWLYYLGWNLGVTVPWRNSIGLAKSKDGIHFERVQLSPVLDRNYHDPFSISYPWVIKTSDIWHMWYGSNLSWGESQEEMAHLIKYASSTDGVNWNPSGEISVPFQSDSEYAISKPCVVREDGKYKMWYSYRGDAYRIGYAESPSEVDFNRLDNQVGISVSSSGWDSETIEYPCVFDHKGCRYMLYNGNRYGLSGIGLAIQDV